MPTYQPKPKMRALISQLTASALLIVVGGVISLTATAGAQTSVLAQCPSENLITFGTEDQFFGFLDHRNHLVATGPTTQLWNYSLAPGTYDLEAVSVNWYEGRRTEPSQPNEQWFAEFLSDSGDVLATSGNTVDLETEVDQAIWAGSIGQIEVDQPVTQVRLLHSFIDPDNTNSVRAACLGAAVVAPPETTVAPSTVPETASTQVPEVTIVPETSTTVAPEVTETSTTTLPEAPVADPQEGEPTFTG